jgi:carbon-monoxide dehydrogenase large subunit
MAIIGRALRRLDADRLVAGRGEFIDDVPVPGALHVAIVRSTYAHARLRSIDTTEALRQPGVVAIVTAADLGAAIRTRRGSRRTHPCRPRSSR